MIFCKVVLALDPNWGINVKKLHPFCNYWLWDSNVNRDCIEKLATCFSEDNSLISFLPCIQSSSVLNFEKALDQIFEHHNEYNGGGPVDLIVVHGIELNSEIEALICQFELSIVKNLEQRNASRTFSLIPE